MRKTAAILVACVLVTLSACSSPDDVASCSEFSTPADAYESADAVYGGAVLAADALAQTIQVDTTGTLLGKGDALGLTLAVELPGCVDVPAAGDSVVMFLQREDGELTLLRGSPGIIRVEEFTGQLPDRW